MRMRQKPRETVASGCSGREIDRDGFHRRVVAACEHLLPAFGLALECNLGRKRLGELARDFANGDRQVLLLNAFATSAWNG
jgi:hypothetical protein